MHPSESRSESESRIIPLRPTRPLPARRESARWTGQPAVAVIARTVARHLRPKARRDRPSPRCPSVACSRSADPRHAKRISGEKPPVRCFPLGVQLRVSGVGSSQWASLGQRLLHRAGLPGGDQRSLAAIPRSVWLSNAFRLPARPSPWLSVRVPASVSIPAARSSSVSPS